MKALLLFLFICVGVGCGSDEKIVAPSPSAKKVATQSVMTATQSQSVLVSNLDEPTNSVRDNHLGGRELAQEFTTGSHAAGYTLTSVEVDLERPDVGGTTFTVAVHASSGGRPGSELATLTETRTIHTGTNRFTHTGLDLEPSTSYFVVIDSEPNVAAIVRMTSSDSESGETGWVISYQSFYRASGSTGAYSVISSQSWKMGINGAVRTVPPPPPPGQVLVSNWQWEPSDESSRFYNHDHAQEFTTGSHGLGYTLTSVELHLVISGMGEETDVKRNLDVAIYTSSGGVPGSWLATLTKPQTTRNGFNEYTHAGLDLSPSTSYFVVMDGTQALGAVKNTVSGGETGAAGWTIGNSSLYRAYDLTTGPWETFSQTKRLRINGDLKKSALTVPSNCGATAITPGLHKGELTSDCPSLRRAPGVNARHVSFSLASRQQVELTLESSDFDTYLYLGQGKDPASATWTHQNDNIGYNDLGIDYDNNSRLAVTLDAGDYVAELTSLEANKTGSFTLTLKTSAPPASTPESDPLPAPTGLVVTSSFVDDGRITISADWKPVKGADFYRIRLTDGSGGQDSRKLSLGSSLGFFEAPDNIVRPGTTYTVEVSANDGPNKATAQVTTQRRPTGLTVTPVTGNTQALDVSWDPMPGATGYCLNWRTPPGSGSYGITSYYTRQTTTRQLTGLEPGTEYEVRLGYQTGFSTDCTVRPAATARGTTKSLAVGEIQGLRVVGHPTEATSLLLYRNVPGATNYRHEQKVGTDPSDPFTAASHRDPNSQRTIIQNLQPDTEYTFRVTALRSGRELGSGEVVGSTRAEFGGVEATREIPSDDVLIVSWPAIEIEPSLGSYRYTVEHRKEGTADWIRVTTRGVSPQRITGLTPNANYAIRVIARHLTASGGFSGEQSSATATGTTLPLFIQGVEAKTDYTNQNQLKVFWEDDSRADHYRVEYRKGIDPNPYDPDGSTELDGSVTPSPPQFTTSSTISRANLSKDVASFKATATVTGLEAGTTYTVQVVAIEGTSTGHEMGSGRAVGTTRGTNEVEPVPPTLTVAVNPVTGEDTQLAASWNAVEGAVKYHVSWKEGVVGKPWSQSVETTDTSYTITGLSPDTPYVVYVAATGANGYMKADDSEDGRTSGAPPQTGQAIQPEPPQSQEPVGTAALTGLTAASVSGKPTQLLVSWDEVQGASTYSVRWKTGNGSYGDPVEFNETRYIITGLTANTSYTVNVAALDGNNTLLAEATASGATVAEATEPRTGEAGSDTEDATPAVSFVIYHDPNGGAAAVDRYNEAVALLDDAGISYSVVRGDVQDDASSLAGVTNSVMPRFFLGDPTAADWTSQPGGNNGGLRWLKQKVAELSD